MHTGLYIQGTMYDYIFRAENLGWSVVVADPRTDLNEADGIAASPHLHLQSVWQEVIEACPAPCVAVVAHSYGIAIV